MKNDLNITNLPISRSFIKRVVYTVLVFFVLEIVFVVDMATPFGGNIHFYSEWARCGTRPYHGDTLLGGHVEYYNKAPIIGIFRGYQTKYYCTPLEAERAGLSASPHEYSFPHLNKRQ